MGGGLRGTVGWLQTMLRFYLILLRLVRRWHHCQRLQPATCFLAGVTICTVAPKRRPAAAEQHVPAVVDLKMFDIEVSGLRWCVFTSFQTKTKTTMDPMCQTFTLFSLYFSVITGPLLWIAISRSGNMCTLWEEQESRWTNIKRKRNKKWNKFRSPHKYCGLHSSQIKK